jgi:hypothetical protein
MSGLGRRLARIEDEARKGEAFEDAQEREKRCRMTRESAEQANDRLLREGEEPIFEITESGDVYCIRDGRPVTHSHQTLAEEWYWDYVAFGNPAGLIHDEESEGFYMPNGELAFSRDRCYLPRFFWAIGDPRADPYCISVPERINISKGAT